MCVHISRNPLEVAHSLKARNGIPVAVGLALWELYNVRALQAATELPLLRVTYEDLVGDPVRTAETIRLFLAERGSYPIRTPTECELSASLDSNLRHHHREMGALSKVATADQLALYRQLIRSETPIDAPRAVSEGSLNVLRKYEAASNVDDRRRAAMESNARRQRSHLELQIALRDIELRTQQNHLRSSQQTTAYDEQFTARHEKLKQDLDQKRRRNAELERLCRRGSA